MIAGLFVLCAYTAALFLTDKAEQTHQALVPAKASSQPVEVAFPHVILPQTTLFSALRQLDVAPVDIDNIVKAAKPVQDLTRLRAGIRFRTIYQAEPSNTLTGIQFRNSSVETLDLKKVNNQWVAEKILEKVDIKVVTFSGVVTSSLWASAEQADMDPSLISELSEIFGWQVDFAREVRPKDRWRLAVEQKFVKGEPIGWGSILAAEYDNAGETHQAVMFSVNGESLGYFSPDGASLRRMFLKSPLRFGRVSSRFQRKRFHPILQVNRAHLGVDYAAPIGTPIRAVGDGTVIFAGASGGGGNVIKIRHNSTYQTAYKHLSGYAKGIRTGARVSQGQTIGYVGNTGLSTAPHLHFEFFQNGQYVDPLGKKFPSADPVPSVHMSQFRLEVASKLATLPTWENVEITLREQTASDVPKAINEESL